MAANNFLDQYQLGATISVFDNDAVKNLAKFNNEVKQSPSLLGKMTAGLKNLAQGFGKVTAGISPLSEMLNSGMTGFVDAEHKFKRMSLQLGTGRDAMKEYADDLDNLQMKFGITQDTMMEALNTTIKKNIKASQAEHIEILRKASEMKVGLGMDPKSSVTMISDMKKFMGGTVQEIGDKFDVLHNKAGIAVESLQGGFKRMAPLIKKAGMNVNELFASIMAMKKAGVDPAQGQFNMMRFLLTLDRGGKHVPKGFRMEDLKAKGMEKFISDIVALREKGKMTDKQLTMIFGSVRGFNGMLELASKGGLKDYKEALDQMNKSEGSLAYSTQQMGTTFKEQLARLKEIKEASGDNMFEGLLAGFGGGREKIPALLDKLMEYPSKIYDVFFKAGEGIRDFFDKYIAPTYFKIKEFWDGLSDSTKSWIAKIAIGGTILVAALGPIGKVWASIHTVTSGILQMGGSLLKVFSLGSGPLRVLTSLPGLFGGITLALMALGLGSEEGRKAIGDFFKTIKDAVPWEDFKRGAVAAIDAVKGALKELGPIIGASLETLAKIAGVVLRLAASPLVIYGLWKQREKDEKAKQDTRTGFDKQLPVYKTVNTADMGLGLGTNYVKVRDWEQRGKGSNTTPLSDVRTLLQGGNKVAMVEKYINDVQLMSPARFKKRYGHDFNQDEINAAKGMLAEFKRTGKAIEKIGAYKDYQKIIDAFIANQQKNEARHLETVERLGEAIGRNVREPNVEVKVDATTKTKLCGRDYGKGSSEAQQARWQRGMIKGKEDSAYATAVKIENGGEFGSFKQNYPKLVGVKEVSV